MYLMYLMSSKLTIQPVAQGSRKHPHLRLLYFTAKSSWALLPIIHGQSLAKAPITCQIFTKIHMQQINQVQQCIARLFFLTNWSLLGIPAAIIVGYSGGGGGIIIYLVGFCSTSSSPVFFSVPRVQYGIWISCILHTVLHVESQMARRMQQQQQQQFWHVLVVM